MYKRQAFVHHKSLAVGLRGVHRQRTIGDTFEQSGSGDTYIDMADLGMLIGSGGVLSHAPRPVSYTHLDVYKRQNYGFRTGS